jgi:hypothetical protein
VDGLKERILQPDALNQGEHTNFCWASACMSYTYGTDPVQMVEAMFALYTTGTFTYGPGGRLSLTPSDGVRDVVGTDEFANNKGLAEHPIDQMLFMTLADVEQFKGATNIFNTQYDGKRPRWLRKGVKPGDQENAFWSGRTFEATVSLLKAFGYDVTARGSSFHGMRLMQSPTHLTPQKEVGLPDWAASELAAGKDVILFVNGPLLRDETASIFKYTVGTHFIRVRSMEQVPDIDTVTFEYLDYGKEKWTGISMPNDRLRYLTHGVISIDLPR